MRRTIAYPLTTGLVSARGYVCSPSLRAAGTVAGRGDIRFERTA